MPPATTPPVTPPGTPATCTAAAGTVPKRSRASTLALCSRRQHTTSVCPSHAACHHQPPSQRLQQTEEAGRRGGRRGGVLCAVRSLPRPPTPRSSPASAPAPHARARAPTHSSGLHRVGGAQAPARGRRRSQPAPRTPSVSFVQCTWLGKEEGGHLAALDGADAAVEGQLARGHHRVDQRAHLPPPPAMPRPPSTWHPLAPSAARASRIALVPHRAVEASSRARPAHTR
eukprot:2026232-Rhodomonas_salina.1